MKMITSTTQHKNKEKRKKKRIILATWNLQGTNEVGAIGNLVREAARYKIEVIALQETNQRGTNITEYKDYMLFNSGGDSNRLGTGFLIKKELKHAVVQFKPISDRMSYLRVRGRHRK
ncbi:hypothetical protein RI129_007862 [Pyrocoelia pectoralis]|uniref:Endonuclease/exonuclease/phosphatase domain-containing protein n=1 Tax=Pyrocoelia pectoralis TaxID=417401 RepID=A0AAN7ZIV6_9COLE